ncbi:hypothetical protein ABC733_17205 [Mangrovibacter sp. SLW1]
MTEFLSLFAGAKSFLLITVAGLVAAIGAYFSGRKIGTTQAKAADDVQAAKEETQQAQQVVKPRLKSARWQAMLKQKMLLSAMILLATGCANQNTTPTIKYITVDSSCTAFQPIRTHGKDADVMDIRTVRAINTHNDTWDRICGSATK